MAIKVIKGKYSAQSEILRGMTEEGARKGAGQPRNNAWDQGCRQRPTSQTGFSGNLPVGNAEALPSATWPLLSWRRATGPK